MGNTTLHCKIAAKLAKDYGLHDIPQSFVEHVITTRDCNSDCVNAAATYNARRALQIATYAFLVANEWQRGLVVTV